MDKTRRRRAPMKNPSRERMKAEIAMLRDQLATLETNKLLLTKQNQRRPTDGSIQPMNDELRAAQHENKRLRRAMSQQLYTIKTTIATLQAYASRDAGWLRLDRQPSLSTVLHDDYGYRFAALAETVKGIYSQVDRMIQFKTDNHAHPRKLSTTFTGPNYKASDQQLLMLESRETTLIPYYDLKHCHEAMWRAVNESAWSDYNSAYIHAATTDSVWLRLQSNHIVRGETVSMTASVVVQRFVVDDRCVIVYRGVSSLDGYDELDDDVYVDESCWSVMQRVFDDELKESVIKKNCVQWAPLSFSEDGDHAIAIHPETNAFTNLVLAASANDSKEISEMMENTLIDECMSE